ncbi:MAG TPA: hotdog domain-containing protein [Acidimicrobiia bacterium]
MTRLSPRQEEIVRHTLAEAARSLAQRSAGIPTGPSEGTARSVAWTPEVGAVSSLSFLVAPEDTAAGQGHPDPEVKVLASPQLAAWFEITASAAMPTPPPGVRHLGVGILVHHLGAAHPGEEVVVRTRVTAVEGRRVLIDCEATVGERLVAFGTHHRVLRPDAADEWPIAP